MAITEATGVGREEAWWGWRWCKTWPDTGLTHSAWKEFTPRSWHPCSGFQAAIPALPVRQANSAHTPSLYRIEIIMVKSLLAGGWLTPQHTRQLFGKASEWWYRLICHLPFVRVGKLQISLNRRSLGFAGSQIITWIKILLSSMGKYWKKFTCVYINLPIKIFG